METIEQIYEEAVNALQSVSDTDKLNALSVSYMGRKGKVTQYLRNISKLPPDIRPEEGKKANRIKQLLNQQFEEAKDRLEKTKRVEDTDIDVSSVRRKLQLSSLHAEKNL